MLLRITHVHDAHPPRYVLLEERGSYVIGGGGSDVVLADATVLGQHARITLDAGRLIVEDLGPGTTLVDDDLISGPVLAELGAWIRIGETIVQVTPGTHLPLAKVFEDRAVSGAEEAFVSALRVNPADDAAREVYADWLEGEGYTIAAQFIRLELEGGADIEDSEIIGEMVDQSSHAWRALISRSGISGCQSYDCPRAWHLLEQLDTPGERRCGPCGRSVRYCIDAGRQRGPVSYDAQVPHRSAFLDDEVTGRRTIFDPDADILDDD